MYEEKINRDSHSFVELGTVSWKHGVKRSALPTPIDSDSRKQFDTIIDYDDQCCNKIIC